MCGIWTRVSHSKDIPLEDLLHPIRTMAHRGPDGYGWFLDHDIAMIHLRLSIIDTEGGKQPLTSFDGRYIGIVNGELYDYRRYRQELASKDVLFNTKSDSEVLLNLFAFEGSRRFHQLSGEFAFIFYDRETRKLIFGRDPHGVKPLFMRHDENGLTLSSEMKGISSDTVEIDPTYMRNYLAHMIVPPQTALKGIEHVLPGRIYEYDFRTRTLKSYFYTKLPLGQTRYLKGIEATERVHHELSMAVKRRMVADVEVGCYLSGGVDSALVAALMVHHGGKPKAFTVGFAEKELDESKKAESIARHLGIEHHVTQLNSKNFMEYLNRSVLAFENPIANPHGSAKNALSRLASQHVKVVLSGEGADEWFGGYAYLRINKLKKFIKNHPKLGLNALANFMQTEKAGHRHLDGASGTYQNIAKDVFKAEPAILGRVLRPRSIEFLTGIEGSSLVHEAMLRFKELMNEEKKGDWSEWDLNNWFSVRTDLFHYILSNLGDRQEMAHSLEGRTPFLDTDLIRTASQVEINTLIRGLNEKSILKEIAHMYLPKDHAQQKKHAFFAPMKYLYLKHVEEEIAGGVALAQKHCPWLPWKNLQHVLETGPRNPSVPFKRDLKISLRLMLHSVGILAESLHKPQLLNVRGYQLPERVEDLLPHRFYPTHMESVERAVSWY